MNLQFVSDWPPERVEQDAAAAYRFDPDRWIAAMRPIYRTFVGYAIAQKTPAMPWSHGIWLAARRHPTLESAMVHIDWLRPRRLTVSERSCYRNHLSAYERIVASGNDLALIVEDDIVLHADSIRWLRRFIRNRPDDLDLVDIVGGVNMAPRAGSAVTNKFFYRVTPPRDRASCGYLISRRFCTRLLELVADPVLPIDWAVSHVMARTEAVVYWTYPPAFVHGSKSGAYPETVLRAEPEALGGEA